MNGVASTLSDELLRWVFALSRLDLVPITIRWALLVVAASAVAAVLRLRERHAQRRREACS